ncbi:MAG: DUF6600 domain-containing protein [Terriglobales bacterium]|jgi:hypothetical protein
MNTSRRVAFATLFSVILSVSALLAQGAPPPGAPPPPNAPPASATPMQAQTPPPPSSGPDNNGQPQGDTNVPGRAVDLHYVSGQVSIQPAGVNDWVEGAVNRPLTTADKVWADKDSRAELHLGTGVIRIGAETSMTLTNVSDQTVQIELDQGALNLNVRKLYDGEVYEVDTQNLAFTVDKPGNYRFDMDPNAGTTKVTVWKGEGEATAQGPAAKLTDGQEATFSNGQSLDHKTAAVAAPDGFDDWARSRDEHEAKSASAKYVPQDVSGASDLDDYGKWHDLPGYGPVWAPAVAPGWAPYRYGHWAWIAPWGWTWVDAAPWGYGPAHYGRWVFVGGSWGWSPGPFYGRPVYAPALVGWVGGPGWGVGVSFGVGFGVGGGVGWFPLGYREPYYPVYGGRTVVNNVNVTNVTNVYNTNNGTINNTNTGSGTVNTGTARPGTVGSTNAGTVNYANRNVPGAMTAVPTSTLTSSSPVDKSAVSVPPSEAAKAPMQSAAPVTPTRSSVLGSNAGSAASRPPLSASTHSVVTHQQPPARPIPFARQREALAQNPGHPLDAQTQQQVRSQMHNPMANGRDNAMAPHNVPRPPQSSSNQAHPQGTSSGGNSERSSQNGSQNSNKKPAKANHHGFWHHGGNSGNGPHNGEGGAAPR